MVTARYTQLDPRRELEQRVAEDLAQALAKRGGAVRHYGTSGSNAPASAPTDIDLRWTDNGTSYRILVEVTQRQNESEFGALVDHLDRAVVDTATTSHVLYSGKSTSPRMVRLIRNENQRRQDNNIKGRIVFLRLNDLQDVLVRWRSYPAAEIPIGSLLGVIDRWGDFTDDLTALQVFQEVLFPDWVDKAEQIEQDIDRQA